ncbi:MAG TPA: hypothetical protein VMD55_08025 [Terracidiphilus sp.]|jgi:hypothetical protein|nr:hypothetical protein [Terracidiphilus sp.]
MGREAQCVCEWNGVAARVKALLEPPELILRGEIKRRVPFSAMKQIAVLGARLRFRVEGEAVSLELGEALAGRWAQALLKPPPTLAQKLGIAPGCAVRIFGSIDDEALKIAFQDARKETRGAPKGKIDVIVARVNTAAQIREAWRKAAAQVENGAALWMVYPKGRGHAINEADVRDAGLAAGFVDVKVAAVSAALTGLKFVRRQNLKPK